MKNRVCSTLFLLVFWFGVLFSVADTFIKSRYACQGEKLRIRCKSRRMIRIYSANYGRTEPGSSICPNVNTTDTTCTSSKAMDIVTKKCTRRARCNIKADGTMFPDPCPNTFKYLDVIYGCVPRPATMTTEAPRKRRRTTPRYRATTTTAKWVTDYQPTTQPPTTRKATTTQTNITTTTVTSSSTSTARSPTPIIEVKKTTMEPTSEPMQIPSSTTPPPPVEAKSGYIQRGEKEFLINLVVSLYLTYVILSGQPKYVLILFLSGVAIATVLLLVLLLGLHLKGRRTKKFVMEQAKELEPNDEADDEIEEDDSDDENKNVTIEIQGENEEMKQISVKPGDIIIIDSKDVDNDDSEDLGYMSEIVRYYNGRNMVQDDGKQSLTCETPSVNSIPISEVGDKREPQYDDVPKDNGICVT